MSMVVQVPPPAGRRWNSAESTAGAGVGRVGGDGHGDAAQRRSVGGGGQRAGGSRRVEGEGPARGRFRVPDAVDRPHAHGVRAVRREIDGIEGVRPVAAGERGVVPNLASAREPGAVPVVAGALADGDLDLGDAGAGAVAVRPAEPRGGAAGVPAGGVVGACGGREGDRRGGRRGVDEPGEGGRGAVGVAGDVGRADVEGVAPVRQARVALGARAGAPGAGVEAALEGGAGLARGEVEVGARRAGRVGGVGVDRRLRRRRVVGEGPARVRLRCCRRRRSRGRGRCTAPSAGKPGAASPNDQSPPARAAERNISPAASKESPSQ